MDPKNLDPALRAKVNACTTPEEVLALAKEEGYTLTDDDLDQISGGFWSEGSDGPICPYCGSGNLTESVDFPLYKCLDCGQKFQLR